MAKKKDTNQIKRGKKITKSGISISKALEFLIHYVLEGAK